MISPQEAISSINIKLYFFLSSNVLFTPRRSFSESFATNIRFARANLLWIITTSIIIIKEEDDVQIGEALRGEEGARLRDSLLCSLCPLRLTSDGTDKLAHALSFQTPNLDPNQTQTSCCPLFLADPTVRWMDGGLIVVSVV